MFDKVQKSPPASYARYFFRWVIVAYIEGAIGGVIGGIFARAIAFVTGFRVANDWMLFTMPLVGIVIVWLYRVTGEAKNKGTNTVLEAISAHEDVTFATGPLIFISTILSHLAGASAGREGAALQIGGWVGELIGRAHLMHLDEKERKIAVMCGMSAVFGALFGTPVAAGIFCMEVVSVGIMHYAAMLPCFLAAFVGRDVAGLLGVKGDAFVIQNIPEIGAKNVQPAVLLGILLAILSIVFIVLLHGTQHKLREWFPNQYHRILVTSVVIIGATLLTGTRVYCGSSMSLIVDSLEGSVPWEAFILKMLFTALALGCGFRGGEIIPTLCVGASFGYTYGSLIGFEPSLMAACGMIGLFAAVTNCPIASIIMGMELFGGQGLSYFAVVISLSYSLSGYYSLYGSQKFIYAKIKNEYLNRKSN